MPDIDPGPTWQETDSQTFLKYGVYFVPAQEQQLDILCTLLSACVGGQPALVLDLCCGAGMLSQAILARFPDCHIYGFDGSTTMLNHAQQTLVAYGPRFRTMLFDLAAEDWRYTLPPIHAIVSSLAIHHLDDRQKQQLFRDLFAMLTPGGILAIADVIAPASPQGTLVAAQAWDQAVRQRARERDGTDAAFEVFTRLQWNMYHYPDLTGVDKPSRLSDQLAWLTHAGFQSVDVYWMQAGHAIFGGEKPI